MSKPTLYIAIDMTGGILKVHKPVGLECEIEILELDEPDGPGLKARGLEHPEDESNRLERLHKYRQCPPSATLASTPPAPQVRPLIRFEIGSTVMTPAIEELVLTGQVNPAALLTRHRAGDWGDLGDEDKARNDEAVLDGSRIFSSYDLPCGKIWCITEAKDDDGVRQSTTILLPEEC